ncbi:unnamed protein product [Pieris macdunnoughi]|uniref:Uncharacterized protein n=1 Tax=Pieris macdunnoughi TaxID=345717 RepID=A0A821WT44_9NEOP|nr:unnamed protein product [Pieris macdunnoughi]
MASLIKSQIGYKETLKRAYQNFRKSPKDRLAKVSYIKTKLELLESDWKTVTNNHNRILENFDSTIEEEYLNVYEELEDTYLNYKLSLLDVLPNSDNVMDNPCMNNQSCKGESNLRLPKISIPVFSGNYSDWQTFKDLFESLIHNNTS